MSKIYVLLFLLSGCLCFGQTTKTIHGKVSYQGSYQQNVDVINFTTKKITQTNALGAFVIDAGVNDVLVLMSEHFADQKYTITADDFEKGSVLIKLVEKPVPLKEVEIVQVKAIKLETASYNDMKMTKIMKEQGRPKNRDVYTGEIENGIDFIQIGKMIGQLFKRKDAATENKTAPLPFREYAKANFKESFFSQTLKIKPADTARFLEYCEADPKSKTVTQNNDELEILGFLLAKKTEFEKLK